MKLSTPNMYEVLGYGSGNSVIAIIGLVSAPLALVYFGTIT